jgi:uncharacterized RDD family membrane protein YckC
MKCPKCAYLGFDTGERCKNCGYDFSLMATEEPAAELSLRLDTDETSGANNAAAAAALNFEPTLPPTLFRGDPSLPLFGGAGSSGEDEPLIKVPARPRPPLAVRRTPESPRSRTVAKPIERSAPAPALDFAEESVVPINHEPAFLRVAPEPKPARVHLETSSAVARALAALIDHAILLTIDAAVVYLTLRISGLTLGEWTALPMLPMITFLGLLKLSYFTAFTCVGGQTIGKMAAGIRVVTDDDKAIDAPHAVHRALAGAVSFAILGAGFLPALFASDRRALHDRLAHTRVVTLPTA